MVIWRLEEGILAMESDQVKGKRVMQAICFLCHYNNARLSDCQKYL